MKLIIRLLILTIISAAAISSSKVSRAQKNTPADGWKPKVWVRFSIPKIGGTTQSWYREVTTEPKPDQQGLIYYVKLSKISMGQTDENALLPVFMEASNDTTMIPFRKIASCTPIWVDTNQYKYENLIVYDDMKNGISTSYNVSNENYYKCCSKTALSASRDLIEKFCANIMTEAKAAQKAIKDSKIALLKATGSYVSHINLQITANMDQQQQKEQREKDKKLEEENLTKTNENITKVDKKINDNEQKLNELDEQIKKAKTELDLIIKELAKIQKQLDSKQEELKNYDESKTETINTIQTNKSSKTVLENNKKNYEGNILKLSEPIAKNNDNKIAAQKVLEDILKGIDDFKKKDKTGIAQLIIPVENYVKEFSKKEGLLDFNAIQAKMTKDLNVIYPPVTS